MRFFLQTGNIGVLLLEVGVDAGRYRALAKSEPNEEKQTCPSHKTSDITNAPNRYPSSSKNSTSTREAGLTTSPKAIQRKPFGILTITWDCAFPDTRDDAASGHGGYRRMSASMSIFITVWD